MVKRSGPRIVLAVLVLTLVLATAGCELTSPSSSPSGSSAAVPTVAVPAAATDLEQTVQTVIRRVQPSIVEVQASGGSQGQSIGSGEVIATGGYIVTNDHVVRGSQQLAVVLANGQTAPATLVGEAPEDDLAVLKTNAANLRPISLGDSNAVLVGTFVLAIGSPLGLDQSVTSGIVSALNRTASEAPSGPAGVLTGLIQTSAPINPGNSGGALVNLRGELIGIPTLGVSNPQNGQAVNGIAFAIPSNRVKFVADQLIKNGRVTSTGQGFLGITGVDVTPDIASTYGLPVDHGVLISDFVPDASGKSPAEQAGLRTGDIILTVNQSQIASSGDLAGVLLALAPGTRVQVMAQRGTSQQTVTVTLGERPSQ
ncbi:MAG TPA: trypsin-like peptidase domain-containing protein [Ktedonobacterales bacterium]|nr:trypsin-like peptidase domain-containing protein [Ktedonobacterales bacterium]